MSIIGLLFQGALFACFITFVVVTVSIMQSRRRRADQPRAQHVSTFTWVIASLLGLVVWMALSFILNVGHNYGATGIRGLFGTIVLFGGPLVYLLSGYRQYMLTRPAPAEDRG